MTGLYYASSTCPACDWPEADAELVEDDEGLVVAVAFNCRACTTMTVIHHE